MKKLIVNVALIASFIFVSACREQKEQESKHMLTDTASIKASIDSLGGVVQKAHDTKDSALLASTWASDGILIVAGNPPVYGRDAIVSELNKMPPLPPGSEMKIHPIEIKVLSPEWAYVLGVDSLKLRSHGSTKETVKTSTFLVVVHKTSEGWQTYRETLTPNQKMD